MDIATADLCDEYIDKVQILEPGLISFGKKKSIHGPMVTLRTYQDNSHVARLLERPGEGRVLVVDGGGSLYCALLGDRLGALAVKNGWAGIVIHGALRDAAIIGTMDLGVWAMGTCPRKSIKQDRGEVDVELGFLGVRFSPGEMIYADTDGLLISREPLFVNP